VGDLNGDTKTDVAAANYDANTVSVLLGNGAGALGARSDYGTGTKPIGVAIGDLNGDGKPDLAVVNEDCSSVSVLLNVGPAAVGVEPGASPTPKALALLPPRPNPTTGVTGVRLVLPAECAVTVEVFDVAGRGVRSLARGQRLPAGEHSLVWDGRDGAGSAVPSGVYLVRAQADDDMVVQRLVVIH
jgi:hypothetical protein